MTAFEPGDRVICHLGDGRDTKARVISNDRVVLPLFIVVETDNQEILNIYRNQVEHDTPEKSPL